MSTSPITITFPNRFAQACQVASFTLDRDGPSYLQREVATVQCGHRVKLDGIFFTEEEACISADLLCGTFCSARADVHSYALHWNPSPAREAAYRLKALQCREMLARRLGAHLSVPKGAA